MKNPRILNFILVIALLYLVMKINRPESSPVAATAPVVRTDSNHTLETIHQRKSVRNFLSTPVAESDLIELIRAGMAAPTAVNKQPWSFITVQDRAVLDSLGDQLPYAKMLHTAPAALVVCGDMNLALTGVNQDYWVQDCSAATQNILLAAESMGLGAVWTAAFPYADRMDPIRAALNLPEHVIPLNIIPLGYPAGTNLPKDKWAPEKVHLEKYGEPLMGHTEGRMQPTLLSDAMTHQTMVSLTVAESKRLIARGLLRYPPIQAALQSGRLIVTKGTTNTYIAEELAQESFTSGEFVYGHILPATATEKLNRKKTSPELSLLNGVKQEIPYSEFIQQMEAGDVVLKGANLINYEKGQAAVLAGHPTGGTWGVITPVIAEKKLHFIIPVGLEKDCSQDLYLKQQATLNALDAVGGRVPKLKMMQGELFTEIEALQQFAQIEALPFALGGVGGAEGAVTLLIRGKQAEVEKALQVIKTIQGEPPYLAR